MIKAILACDDVGGVSKNGTIPWPKNKKDLGWFKKNTTDNVVVMGSKTWVDPLMPWPLPNRVNVLATSRKADFPGADKYVCGNLKSELKNLKEEHQNKTIWVIGGPNIIEQTVRQKLPSGFQRSEFLLEKGHIDMIISRNEMRDRVASVLSKFLNLPEPADD